MAPADRPAAELCSRTHAGITAGVMPRVIFHLLGGESETNVIVFLLKEDDEACVGPTASILLGNPAPPLGQLPASLKEDAEAVERLRSRLQADWNLLLTTGESTEESSLTSGT